MLASCQQNACHKGGGRTRVLWDWDVLFYLYWKVAHGSCANGKSYWDLWIELVKGGGGGMRSQPQFGLNGLAQRGAALPKSTLIERRKEIWDGMIVAAIYSYNWINCARADRGCDDKVAAMLPRNDLNWQAMAWKIFSFNSPSSGKNPSDNAMEGGREEVTIRTEMDVPLLCHVDMYLLALLPVSGYAEMVHSFWMRSQGTYLWRHSKSVQKSWARWPDLAGFICNYFECTQRNW